MANLWSNYRRKRTFHVLEQDETFIDLFLFMITLMNNSFNLKKYDSMANSKNVNTTTNSSIPFVFK